jgi:type III pantothenate kinase
VSYDASEKSLNEAITYLKRHYQQKFDVDYFDAPPSIFLSCVVPSFKKSIIEQLTPLYKIISVSDYKKRLLYQVEMAKGVEEIADDLLLGALAGNYLIKKPALLIDSGTATTISYFDEKGFFAGCSIAPGPLSQFKSLMGLTALIPDIYQKNNYSFTSANPPLLGTNTAECVASGTITGHGAMLTEMIRRIEKKFNQQLEVYLIGGFATTLASLIDHPLHLEPTLLLRTMIYLYKMKEVYL